MSYFEKLGGRKMVMTLIVVTVGALVEVFAPNGISANFAGLLAAAAAVFGASNAAISVAGLKQPVLQQVEQASEPTRVEEFAIVLEERLAKAESQIASHEQALKTATQLLTSLLNK